MKALFLIIDGMEDLPAADLRGRTPLEAASCCWLEKVCEAGRFVTTPKGRETDSQTCILTLLGVSPERIPQGRAALEAAAAGIEARPGDLLLRGNLVKVADGRLTSACVDGGELASELIEQASRFEGCRLYYLSGFRFLLRIEDAAALCEGLKTYPPQQHLGDEYSSLRPHGALGAVLWEISGALLKLTNTVTLHFWSQSVWGSLPKWEDLYSVRAAMAAETQAVRGIAMEMGLPCPRIPGATGDTDTDLRAKADAAIRLLEDHELVIVHAGGADEASHRRNPHEKADFLARVDRELISPLLDQLPEADALICSDHATLCESGTHHPMPVRFWTRRPEGTQAYWGELDGKQAVNLLVSKGE